MGKDNFMRQWRQFFSNNSFYILEISFISRYLNCNNVQASWSIRYLLQCDIFLFLSMFCHFFLYYLGNSYSYSLWTKLMNNDILFLNVFVTTVLIDKRQIILVLITAGYRIYVFFSFFHKRRWLKMASNYPGNFLLLLQFPVSFNVFLVFL